MTLHARAARSRPKPTAVGLRVFLSIPGGVAGSGGAVVASPRRPPAAHPENIRPRGRSRPTAGPPAGRRDGSLGPARRAACGRAGHRVVHVNNSAHHQHRAGRREQAPLMRRSRMARGAAERRRAGRDNRHRSRLRRAPSPGEGNRRNRRNAAKIWRLVRLAHGAMACGGG